MKWWNKPPFSPHKHPSTCVHTQAQDISSSNSSQDIWSSPRCPWDIWSVPKVPWYLQDHFVLPKMPVRHLVRTIAFLVFTGPFGPVQMFTRHSVHAKKFLVFTRPFGPVQMSLKTFAYAKRFLKFDQMSYGHNCQHQMSANFLNCTLEMGLNSTGPVPWWFWGLQNAPFLLWLLQ